jgi:hypothetical protein
MLILQTNGGLVVDSIFVDLVHRKAFYDLLSTRTKYEKQSEEYLAAIYGITSTEKFRNKFSCYVVESGIDLLEMKEAFTELGGGLLIESAFNLFNYGIDVSLRYNRM